MKMSRKCELGWGAPTIPREKLSQRLGAQGWGEHVTSNTVEWCYRGQHHVSGILELGAGPVLSLGFPLSSRLIQSQDCIPDRWVQRWARGSRQRGC